MQIFAQLTFDHCCHWQYREMAVADVLDQLQKCALWFQCVNFRGGKMLVEVMLDTDEVNAPRNEDEAESEIIKEVQKTEMDCTILIISGTQYVDESARYEPQMTVESQLRHGET